MGELREMTEEVSPPRGHAVKRRHRKRRCAAGKRKVQEAIKQEARHGKGGMGSAIMVYVMPYGLVTMSPKSRRSIISGAGCSGGLLPQ